MSVIRYTTLTEQLADFSESFREVELKFNKGAANSVDYLVAKNNMDRAKSNLIIAHYDFILRSKILDYYNGKLSL
jgi:outer membrane protein